MWSRISLRTYGLAGLAILAGVVLAGCPAAQGISKPAVSSQIADISSLAVGSSTSIPLGEAFTGEELVFSASTNNPGVAIATISGNRVIVGAVGAGSAKITVTATNSGGSESQSFDVNVPTPTTTTPTTPAPPTPPPAPTTPTTDYPTDCPSPLPDTGGMFRVTLKVVRERSGKCTLPAKHSLHPPTDLAVTVKGPVTGASENTWTITAKKKGLHVVLISDDQAGETAGEVIVRVPNTPPTWIGIDPAAVDLFDSYPGTAGTSITDTVALAPGGYFDDVDEDDKTESGGNEVGVFKYKVAYKPVELLIDTKDGFVDATDQSSVAAAGSVRANIPITVKALVLKPLKEEFTVQLRAFDRDNAPSDNVVTLKFNAVNPQNGLYVVGQQDNGNFKTVRMGNRLDVDHTLTFGGSFRFATLDTDRELEVAGAHRVPQNHDPTTATECTGGAPANWGSTTTVGEDCFSITASSGLEIRRSTDSPAPATPTNLATPTVTFQLTSTTTSPSITVRYHVWALNTGVPEGDVPTGVPDDTVGPRSRKTYERRLGLSVHRCTVTTDCPLSSD